MHFHLPKPLHGWRAFVGEVGIIVVGVLIALGAEQVVQSVHERQVASAARESVRAEAAINIGFIRDRLSTQACIDRRINELQTILSRSGEGSPTPQPTWVSRPPLWPIFFGRWEAATASGRNSPFSADEQGQFSALYRIFNEYDTKQVREQEVWAQLRTLEWWQGPLGPQARLTFAQALQQAKYLSWDLHYAGTYAIRDEAEMGLAGKAVPPQLHPICLPITASRTDALKRVSDPFGEP
jgi:type II secretory pathway pseudopilin PulG